jgi:hypothetical protein
MMTANSTERDVRNLRSPQDWIVAGILAFGIALLSLGVHDLANTYLGIPYPYDANVPGWARYVGYVVRIATLAYMYHLASWRLGRLSTSKAVLAFGTLVILSFETLRNTVVDNVISEGWIDYRWASLLLTRLPNVLSAFCSGAIAVIIVRQLRQQARWKVIVAILISAAINLFLLLPLFKEAASLVGAAIGSAEVPEVQKPPYGFYVYKFIYSTFIEPTLACFVLIYLMWPSLRGSPLKRGAVFVALLLLMRGRVVQTFFYSVWSDERWPLALAAGGQFFAETLIMAALTALVWAKLSKPVTASGRSER